jgi:SAM-dependent methyltransferase
VTSEGSPWYVEAFGPLYSRIYAHRSDEDATREVSFVLRNMEVQNGARVLDLACGNGRHLRALADAGLNPVGLDLSRPLLEKAAGALPLVRADMRAIPVCSESFEAAFSFFTSFGYFESEEDDLAVLVEVARTLRREGWFLLDFLESEDVSRKLVPSSERTMDTMRVVERRRIEDGRVVKNVRVHDEEGNLLLEYEESVRLYVKPEIEGMLQQAGLEARSWHGDFQGTPVGQGSRLIVIARKVS